jgi:hypothetical protein
MSAKSSVLDQILLEDIARYCPQQFLAFHQCMSTDENCDHQQFQLAGCIKKSVPTFQTIHTICAGKLQAYEACLKMNGNNMEKCKDDLQLLRECALKSIKKE